MKQWVWSLSVGLAVLASARQARAADYGAAGPLQVATSNLAANEGGSIGGYLVVPAGSGPYPLVVASHGWSASADQQLGWAKQFASWGFVVVAPSFPNTINPNDQTDATIIATLAKLYADPAYSSPAQGKVDGARIGLEGHSAGGLATVLAAASIHPQAVVLFDPVDANDDGQKALPSICAPILGVFANASSCNNQEAWWPYANTASGAEVLFRVVGSTHCDGENASRSLCGGVCGGAADSARQQSYARYATAFFLAELAGDPNASALLGQGALSADSALTNVTVKAAASSCAPDVTDASAPDAARLDDGGVVDAGGQGGHDGGSGTASDAGARGIPDAGVGTGVGDMPGSGPADASSGCSCRASTRDIPPGPGAALGLLGVLLALRRAPRSSSGGGRARPRV